MKINQTNCLGCFVLLLSFCSCDENNIKNSEYDYTAYVNPFIGTGGHGHTFPGPVVPFGMIQPSPDTRVYEWDACSGYHYSDTIINGFSHTHLSGTGCGDYGDVLLMPTVGEQKIHSMPYPSQQKAYHSLFSHENEIAEPGYYSVFLDTYQIKAELTASKRGALHRYTFPKSDDAGFILDLDYSLQYQKNEEMTIEVLSDTEICGKKKTNYWAFDQYINFYAKFSKPFVCQIITDSISSDFDGAPAPTCKALLKFKTTDKEQVFVKIGISAVDVEGAKNNVLAEIPDWDFERVRAEASSQWNKYLSKIKIEGHDNSQKQIFYTSLYHTAISPNLFMDVDGRYRGMDQKVHKQKLTEPPLYTIFSLWDTFRALHPLYTIIDPALNNHFVNSLIRKYQEGGIFPMWDLASNYTGTMIGYHAVSVIVDAYMKGYRDFDIQEAYKACLRSAEYDTSNIICPNLVLPHLVPKAKYWKNTLGYIPCDLEKEAVAKALEYAYNDWCISVFAGALGDCQNQKKYTRFAGAYEFYYDKTTGFMRGLDSKGEWRTPFNARFSSHRNDDYCEGTAWQWSWFVPHDIEGLVSLMGGREAFGLKLDSLFIADSEILGDGTSVDITGLIGQYAHGNEPSHHIIHLYNYINQPYKTQALIDSVLQTQYSNDPDGLAGNEDCGQMSAWFVLNSMGFYQVCPGNPVYSIGRPLFDKVSIDLPSGTPFEIIVENNSLENKYIESVSLNGKDLNVPFFTHDDIKNGGIMTIRMTSEPTKWGS